MVELSHIPIIFCSSGFPDMALLFIGTILYLCYLHIYIYTNLTHIYTNRLIVIYKFMFQQSLMVQDFLTLVTHFFLIKLNSDYL